MSAFIDYQDHVGSNPDKYYKATLQQSDNLLLGLNCLEPGQVQAIHAHADQDKFYHVLAGRGRFTVGEEASSVGPGQTVWAAAGIPHGVTNDGDERLVVLVGIAPAPGR